MEYSWGFMYVVKLTVKRGKEMKKQKKASHVLLWIEKNSSTLLSTGVWTKGGKKQCMVHRIGRKRIQELRGGQSREAFGPERHQHLSNTAETGFVQEPHQRSTCLQKAALLGNSAPPADDSGLISAQFSHPMISSSNVISVNVLMVLPGEQGTVMIRTKFPIFLLCTPPKAMCCNSTPTLSYHVGQYATQGNFIRQNQANDLH